MKDRFTEDDRGKDVVTAEGKRVGTIRSVDDDRATVDRSEDDEDLTEKVKDMLGWDDDDDDDEYGEIRSDLVDRHSDDQFRLRQH